jgi:hypothetical protein
VLMSARATNSAPITNQTLTDANGVVSAPFDSTAVQIRNSVTGSTTGLTQTQLTGAEDGGTAYTGEVKAFASGVDASGNPYVLVLSAADRRLDVYRVEPQWGVNADGNWGTAGSWTGPIPDGALVSAKFGSAITAPRTVTLDAPRTVTNLKLDSAQSYTISGTSVLTLNAASGTAGKITVLQGNHTINTPITLAIDSQIDVAASSVLTVNSQISAPGRGLTKLGAGRLDMLNLRASSVNLSDGQIKVLPNGGLSGLSRVGGIGATGNGTIDLTNNGLVIDYAVAGPTPFADIKARLGVSILSSLVTPTGNTALGIAEGSAVPDTVTAISAPGGVAADATSVIVRYTLKGDANLDKSVNFPDLLILAQNYNGSTKEWFNGDFSGDGIVDFSDLLSLAQNYNQSLTGVSGSAASFASDWALAQSLVPEPTTVAALAAVGAVALRRRRR